MTILRRLASVVRGIVNRNGAEADLDDELKTFIDMAAADHVRDGATPEEARRLAALHLGGVEQVKERVRTGRYGAWLDYAARDARYGLRQVRRNPLFSAIAISTLALGIGVNTAMFSAVDAVLIRPLPYADADRLVMVWDDDTRRGGEEKFFTTPPEWHEWRRHNTVFTDIAASQPADAALSNDGEPEELPARKVTANFWSVLGARPLLGRVFTDDEDSRGARVVVISHGVWQRRFGAAPDVVGRTIVLNDNTYEVIGVMPREFYFMPSRDIDVWMPASFTSQMLENWGWHDVHTVARLKPGVTPAQAQEAMAALSLRISAEHLPIARSAVVVPLREELAGKTYASLIVLLAATAAVLLIACVNLANLLLARGTVRRREVAVRAALGAGLGRLIAQLLVENLLLAGLGALAGLALAIPVMWFLETLVPDTMGAVQLTLDWRVLAFSAAIAVAAGLLSGVAPAITGARLAMPGGTARGRPRQRRKPQPPVPARAHRRRNGPGGRAADDRRPAPADVSSPATARSGHSQRTAADVCDAALQVSRLRSARGLRRCPAREDSSAAGRRQRRRDLAHSPDGQRPGHVLPARRPARHRVARRRSRSHAW